MQARTPHGLGLALVIMPRREANGTRPPWMCRWPPRKGLSNRELLYEWHLGASASAYNNDSHFWPGLAGKMNPKPDHGETSYRSSSTIRRSFEGGGRVRTSAVD